MPLDFTSKVRETHAPGVRLIALPTAAPGVVSVHASHPVVLADPSDELIQDVLAGVLDKGTDQMDRHAVAHALESRGAQLGFSSDSRRMGFRGKMLADDAAFVLGIAADLLARPALDLDEVRKAAERKAASYARASTDTGAQADAALSRLLYSPDDPRHTPDFVQSAERALTVDATQVRAHYAQARTWGPLTIVLAGDVEALDLDAIALRFGGRANVAAPYLPPPSDTQAQIVHQFIADKTNADVEMGHATVVDLQHDAYLALRVALFALGGNFSARLMQEVRDKLGLTYGIGASLSDADQGVGGAVSIRVTLSEENIQRGINATRDVVDEWAREGLTMAELEQKKTTLIGTYTVGLATTGGLAAQVHRLATTGFDLDRLDTYPDEVDALTLDQVNGSIAAHVRPGALSTAIAGPVEG